MSDRRSIEAGTFRYVLELAGLVDQLGVVPAITRRGGKGLLLVHQFGQLFKGIDFRTRRKFLLHRDRSRRRLGHNLLRHFRILQGLEPQALQGLRKIVHHPGGLSIVLRVGPLHQLKLHDPGNKRGKRIFRLSCIGFGREYQSVVSHAFEGRDQFLFIAAQLLRQVPCKMGSLGDGRAKRGLIWCIVFLQDVQELIHQRILDRILIESLAQLLINVLTHGAFLLNGVSQG